MPKKVLDAVRSVYIGGGISGVMKMSTVDEYINGLDENGRTSLSVMIDVMRTEFPEIAPAMVYGMPMWKFGTKLYDGYVAVSAAKKHFSVHFYDVSVISCLSEQLSGCTFGKRCVNIRYRDDDSFAAVMESVKDHIRKVIDRS